MLLNHNSEEIASIERMIEWMDAMPDDQKEVFSDCISTTKRISLDELREKIGRYDPVVHSDIIELYCRIDKYDRYYIVWISGGDRNVEDLGFHGFYSEGELFIARKKAGDICALVELLLSNVYPPAPPAY